MDHRNDKMQQELRAVPRAVEQNHCHPIADVGLHPRYFSIRKFHLVSKRKFLARHGKLIVLVLYFDTLTTELEVPHYGGLRMVTRHGFLSLVRYPDGLSRPSAPFTRETPRSNPRTPSAQCSSDASPWPWPHSSGSRPIL